MAELDDDDKPPSFWSRPLKPWQVVLLYIIAVTICITVSAMNPVLVNAFYSILEVKN